MPKQNNDYKDTTVEIARALAAIFKRHTLTTRKRAWGAITSPQGEAEVKKLINFPGRNANTFHRLNFREWLENHDA